MSSSSSVSVSSEFTEFSSTSNESTGRVIESNKNANPALSPETVSCLNSSSKDGVDVEAEEREEMAEQKLSLRRGYEWVNPKVREYFSRYQFTSTLRNFLSKIYVYSPDATEEIISFRRTCAIDNVCHGREGDEHEFFYFYECLFTDLHIRFPLSEFQMGVLRFLNIAPTQLHPNGWAYMQAFSILCRYLSLIPSPKTFLYYYSSRPGKKPSWLSLISKTKVCFLSPFTSSYKNFKGGFFKILIEETGRKYFFDGDIPKFPFYWTRAPVRFNSSSYHSMTTEEKHGIVVLGHFSHKIPTRALLRLYVSRKPQEDFTGM